MDTEQQNTVRREIRNTYNRNAPQTEKQKNPLQQHPRVVRKHETKTETSNNKIHTKTSKTGKKNTKKTFKKIFCFF